MKRVPKWLLYFGIVWTALFASALAQPGGTVLIVVNANLYSGGISSEVLRLKSDLEAEGRAAKITQWPSSGTSSLDLWNHLRSEYTNPAQTLKGAILIGSLPKPQAGGIYNELLYWNMDEFQTNPGVNTRHIWVSRVNVDDTTYGSEVTLMRRALDANHAYRTGQSRLPFTAYRYKNPEWWNYDNQLSRVWPVVEQKGYDINDLRFMPERDDIGNVAGADCMVKGGELFEEESHGEYNSYMYGYGVITKDVIHRNLVQTRVCLIGSCLTGVYGGIANEHLFTRGGGNVLSISNTEISYVGETVISSNTGFLDLLASGMSWGDALVQNWSIGGNSYCTLFGDLSIRPKASGSANAMPVMNSWSPESTVHYAPYTATFNVDASSSPGSGISKVEYYCTGSGYGRTAPDYSGPPAAFNHTYSTPGTYTARIEVVDEYQARTWRESTFVVVNPPGSFRVPENPAQTVQGLRYKYYEGSWNALPDFDQLSPAAAGVRDNFLISPRNADDHFGFQFNGFIDVPVRGVYVFYTNSDDASALYIGDTRVVDNDGLHAMEERSGTIALEAGKHAIRVTFLESGGGEGLEVRWQGPETPKQLVPDANLWRDAVNTTPVASSQNVTTMEGNAKAITLTAIDLDEDPLAYVIVTQPSHGSLTGTPPELTYTPAQGYAGADAFSFKVNDGTVDSVPATVSITVEPLPALTPVYTTRADGHTVATFTTGMGRWSVPAGVVSLEVLVVGGGGSGRTGGAWSGAGGGPGGLWYAGNHEVVPNQSVIVEVGAGGASVIPANTDGNPGGASRFGAIVAYGGEGGTYHLAPNVRGAKQGDSTDGVTTKPGKLGGTSTEQNAVGSAGDSANGLNGDWGQRAGGKGSAFAITGASVYYAGGGGWGYGQSAGGLGGGGAGGQQYQPGVAGLANTGGGGGGTYDAGNSGAGGSGVVVVAYLVNQPPVANAQLVTTSADDAKSIVLTGNDPEGSALSYALVTQPSHGTLTGSAPNLTYTPVAGYYGPDAFTFRVNDGAVNSQPATVSITVEPGGGWSDWSPARISVMAWYDAADPACMVENGGVVSQWNDKSGHNRHVSQATEARRPALAAKTVTFDGTDDFLMHDAAFVHAAGSADVYMVGAVATAADKRIVSENNDSNNNPMYNIAQTHNGDGSVMSSYVRAENGTVLFENSSRLSSSLAFSRSVPRIYQWRDTGASLAGRVSGGAATTVNYTRSVTLALNRFTLGAIGPRPSSPGGSGYVSAGIHEVVITSNLSDTDRQRMEGYLAHKWDALNGTTTLVAALPESHPWKSAYPTVPPGGNYLVWAGPSGHNLSGGPDDDSDGDGVDNFHEFAFGSDPNTGNGASPVTTARVDGAMVVRYQRASNSGLRYSVLTSSDLVSWNGPAAVLETILESHQDGTETIEARLAGAPAENQPLFLRVKAD